MVRHQDDTSFLSWTDTLRPASAASTVNNNGENVWATVYYEVVAEVDNLDDMTYPVATDVVMFDEGRQEDIESLTIPSMSVHTSDGASNIESVRTAQRNSLEVVTEESSDNGHHYRQPRRIRRQPWKHSNLLDLILGLAMSLGAVIFTFKMELVSMAMYLVAVAAHYLTEEVFSSQVYLIPKAILLLIMGIMMFVDSVMLIASVMVTELLGVVALLVCTLLGGPRSGMEWHQFMRRICHLIRWALRSCHEGWKPERVFPLSFFDDEADNRVEDHTHRHVPCPVHDADDELHISTSHRAPYTDDATLETQQDACQEGDGSATTFASVATIIDGNPQQPGIIAVSPERVIVQPDDDNRHFTKNVQHVEIN